MGGSKQPLKCVGSPSEGTGKSGLYCTSENGLTYRLALVENLKTTGKGETGLSLHDFVMLSSY